MMMLKLFFLFFTAPFVLSAQNVETYTKEVELEIDNKKLAQEKALNEISRNLVIEILGRSGYLKQKRKVEKHIIKNRNKYILSIGSSSGQMGETGKFPFTVNIKISKSNLKALLLEHKLLNASKGSYCILPALSFSSHFNQKKQSWSWWKKDQDRSFVELEKTAGIFFESLGKELTKTGFYLLDPVFHKIIQSTPSSVLPKKRRFKDFASLSQFYSCDIILTGFVNTGENLEGGYFFSNRLHSKTDDFSRPQYWTQFFIHVFNIKTKEKLFHFSRQFPFPESSKENVSKEVSLKSTEIIESLVYQLSSYKKSGSLDLSQVMVSLQGPLQYSEKERLVKRLVHQLDGLESLQVIYLSSHKVIYRAEVSKDLDKIEKELKALSLKGFLIKAVRANNRKLELYVKKRN